jgi:hypothetical protein
MPQANGYVYEAAGVAVDEHSYEDCPFEATYDDALNAACELYDVEVGSLSQPCRWPMPTLFKVFSTDGHLPVPLLRRGIRRRPHRSERRGPSRRALPEPRCCGDRRLRRRSGTARADIGPHEGKEATLGWLPLGHWQAGFTGSLRSIDRQIAACPGSLVQALDTGDGLLAIFGANFDLWFNRLLR